MTPFKRVSTADPGEYTSDPEETTDVFIRDGLGRLEALGIEWSGNEYDPESCWLVCDEDDLLDFPE